jgi:uncharacterized phiE125 gp8 family phage protein
MGLILVQGPMVDVLDLALVKTRLRVDTTADDDSIKGIIAAATQLLDGRDGFLGRALMPQTWRLEVPEFPEFPDCIEIPLPPLIRVSGITYLDTDGVEQTLASTVYRVVDRGSDRSRIMLAVEQTWPSIYEGYPDAVRITFDCGYQDLQSPANNPIPEPIQQAIMVLAQSLYDRPGQEDIPQVVRSLLASYRIGYFGGVHLG